MDGGQEQGERAQLLKHWRYFEKASDCLRQWYPDRGILLGLALVFHCLVPEFQKPLGARRTTQDRRIT
jgi:hypothetical protein